jgi:hypothetical protein
MPPKRQTKTAVAPVDTQTQTPVPETPRKRTRASVADDLVTQTPVPEPKKRTKASVNLKASTEALAKALVEAPQPVDAKAMKQQLNELLEVKRPEDPYDRKVTLNGKNERCDSNNIRAGMLLDRPAPLVVLEGNKVRNQELHQKGVDSDWSLSLDLIGAQCWSADHYKEVVELNKTQMAAKIKNGVGDRLFKVVFTKAPEANAMADLIRNGSELIEKSDATAEEKRKAYKALWERSQKGEIRIMRGYIKRTEGGMDIQESDTGMVKIEDADLKAKGQMAERMLNLNNVLELTYELTKYVLK